MKKGKSFTLIELILVISIIIILAVIAIPNFYKTKQRVIEKEGIVNIKLIAAAERIYRMEQVDYVGCTDTSGCNGLLKLMLNGTNWAYNVTTSGSPGSKTANITATSTTGCTYTLDSSNFDALPTPTGCI